MTTTTLKVLRAALTALDLSVDSRRHEVAAANLATLIDSLESQTTRPVESDYTSHVAYCRALEAYCDGMVQLVGAPVAWFAFSDHNGPVPLELYGWDKKACKHAVLTYARAGNWKGTVEGYLMQQGWTLRPVYATPVQPVGQPKTVPLTGEEVVKEFCVTPTRRQYVDYFSDGVQFAEKHHGIGGGND